MDKLCISFSVRQPSCSSWQSTFIPSLTTKYLLLFSSAPSLALCLPLSPFPIQLVWLQLVSQGGKHIGCLPNHEIFWYPSVSQTCATCQHSCMPSRYLPSPYQLWTSYVDGPQLLQLPCNCLSPCSPLLHAIRLPRRQKSERWKRQRHSRIWWQNHQWNFVNERIL